MKLVAEDIIKQLKAEKVEIPKVRCDSNGGGVLKSCNSREISKMSEKEVNMLTFVDNGAMLFNSKDYVI